jgi:hypothetical protein
MASIELVSKLTFIDILESCASTRGEVSNTTAIMAISITGIDLEKLLSFILPFLVSNFGGEKGDDNTEK